MQIHEITLKPVNEGILKGMANLGKGAVTSAVNIGKGVTTGVANKILSKLPVDVSQTIKTPSATSASGAKALAANISKTLVNPVAKEQATDWDKTLNTLQKRYGDPGTPAWPDKLVADDLDSIINRKLLRDRIAWSEIAKKFIGDPADEVTARAYQNRIQTARDQILNVVPKKSYLGQLQTANELMPAWRELVAAAFDTLKLVIQKQETSRTGVKISDVDKTSLARMIDPKTLDPTTVNYLRGLGILP